MLQKVFGRKKEGDIAEASDQGADSEEETRTNEKADRLLLQLVTLAKQKFVEKGLTGNVGIDIYLGPIITGISCDVEEESTSPTSEDTDENDDDSESTSSTSEATRGTAVSDEGSFRRIKALAK